MTPDLDNDLKYVDGLETVTVILKRQSGRREVTTAYALRRAINRADFNALGTALRVDGTSWNVPTTPFDAINDEPMNGDEIISGTQKWRIESVLRRGLAASYRCVCNRVRGT